MAELSTAVTSVLRGRGTAREWALVYLAVFFAFAAVLAVRWPIVAVDTDLWYHLNAGRQIASERALPDRAFFSFLEPSPQWRDYYWLSQLGFYGAWRALGEIGLVGLRALCVLATFAFVLATLRHGRGREGLGASAVAFSAVALVVFPRFAAIRPHLASYLGIALCLYLLDSRRRLLLLPVVAALWVNLHGVEYPVLLLVIAAYLAEGLLAGSRFAPGVAAPEKRQLVLLGLAALAVLLTPHGLALLPLPFTPLELAPQYIDELNPVSPLALFSAGIVDLRLTHPTALFVVLAAACIAIFTTVAARAPRLAHLLLLAGGAFLLLRVQRFSAEFALLALPALRGFRLPSLAAAWLPAPLRAGALLLLALLPLRYMASFVDPRCGFPVCPRSLPEGVAAFLAHTNAVGNVLNHPNDGGYLEWELFPRQKIFVDLQTPFLFPSSAIFAADQAFHDPVVLAALIDRYRPSYLVSRRAQRGFGAVVQSQPEFVPVFVDDAAVLYASAVRAPQVSAAYGLRALDPFALSLKGDPRSAEVRALAEAELRRMNELHPGSLDTTLFEAQLALERGDAARALLLADGLERARPGRPEPYGMRGDALARLERFPEAIAAYREALARLSPEEGDAERLRVQRELWISHSRLGEHRKAWQAALEAIPDVFAPGLTGAELASLGGTALDAGEREQGRLLLELALQKLPPDAGPMRAWIEDRLRAR